MLIDATHPEEVRVAVVDGNRLEEYDSEVTSKKHTKGNIYLAKVIRIEPSLQAAFVEYGANRHGFLPFGEIHPDYYQIPVNDREKMLVPAEPEDVRTEGELTDTDESLKTEIFEGEDPIETAPRRPQYRYKIQEVIKRRQILLVQVVKEERANKGAALTTYLTLAGRYCVLMPNSGHRTGGISRKIASAEDRQRLRSILTELAIPEQMSVIVRTAGQSRNKSEIKRDYEYLTRLWETVREKTLTSIAPTIVYSEGDLVKRAIRDIYHRDVEKVLVAGEEVYKLAKMFMRDLIPSHAKRVQLYRENVPLFQAYKLEEQINSMFQPKVNLPSGGSIVIHATEALVAIDVNSGRSTRERHIDDTAFKTNLEAAEEVARQMRLRDLAGLIVVDFIDMHENKHIHAVEKRFRESIKQDRARIQIGKISEFGLLELSRQRLRPSLMEANTIPCTHCQGTGIVRSIGSTALSILRAIETEGLKGQSAEILVTVPNEVDLYLLNQKRSTLVEAENRYQFSVLIQRDGTLINPEFRIQMLTERKEPLIQAPPVITIEEAIEEEIESEEEEQSDSPPMESTATTETAPTGEKRRRRNRRRQRKPAQPPVEAALEATSPQESTSNQKLSSPPVAEESTNNEGAIKPLRRRHRFGKRQRYRSPQQKQISTQEGAENVVPLPVAQETAPQSRESTQENTGESKTTRKGWWKRLLES